MLKRLTNSWPSRWERPLQRIVPVLRTTPALWLGAVLWMGVIFYFSAQPALPRLTPGAPKLQEVGGHLFVFFVLALLWRAALARTGARPAWAWALLVAALYGASDEFHQSFVPHRAVQFSDWVTDVVGASLALLVSRWWAGRSPKRQARSR